MSSSSRAEILMLYNNREIQISLKYNLFIFLQESGSAKYDCTNIIFTSRHYQNILSFNQFKNEFRPIFMTVNKLSRSNVQKLLETKWKEFCQNNPLLKSEISSSDCSSNEDVPSRSDPKQKKKRVESSEAENSTTEDPIFRRKSKRFRSNELSDEEFERALIQSSESSDSDNGMSSIRRKNFKKRGIIHKKLCEKCQLGGKKIFCRNCPNAYHFDCLVDFTTKAVKTGQWLCPECSALKAFKNRLMCARCRGSDNLIKCQTCPLAFHSSCMILPLVENTVIDYWQCHICKCLPLKNNASKILSWRWKDSSQTCRKFFVKYLSKSYYECSWVDELQLEVYSKMLYIFYARKNNMNDPPIFEYELDIQDDRYKRLLKMGSPIGEERVEFENKFYKYGIEPEWLIVHRVIADQIIDGSKKYLVKWRELGYSFCTWENDNSENILEFQKHVKFYEKMKQFHLNNGLPNRNLSCDNRAENVFFVPPTKPLTNLKTKLEDQPDYIDDSEFKLHPYQMEGMLMV